MGNSKWERVWAESHSDYLEAFKAGFINHIEGKTDGESTLSNLPRKVLNRALEQKNLGMLSRIFDEFKVPVPPYEQIPKDKAGLIDHIQNNLDELLPLILNKNKDGLSQEVINAIGSEEYNDLLNIPSTKDNTQREIASQFIASIITSYGQRMIDQYPDKQHEVFGVLTPMLADMADQVGLSGIPQEMRDAAQNSVVVDVNQQEAEMNLLLENINELNKLVEEVKKSGIQIDARQIESAIAMAKENAGAEHLRLDMRIELVKESYDNALAHYKHFEGDQIKQGVAKLAELDSLVGEVERAGLNIGSDLHEKINGIKTHLEGNSEPLVSKLRKVEQDYKNMVTDMRDTVKKIDRKTPEQVNCIIRLLRFITGNERLFQQDDEKRFETNKELIGKITTFSEGVAPVDESHDNPNQDQESDRPMSP